MNRTTAPQRVQITVDTLQPQDYAARARRLYDRVANHHGFIRYDYPMG